MVTTGHNDRVVPRVSRQSVTLWALYDFGASIASMAFLVYFSQWLVIDSKQSELSYNLLYVYSSILLLISAPFTSVLIDKTRQKIYALRSLTLWQFGFLILCSCLASYFKMSKSLIIGIMIVYVLANYFHQFAMVFYNALLPNVAPAGAEGRVPGVGQAARWMGALVALALCVRLSAKPYSILGHAGRSQTFLPATVLALIVTIPSLFLRINRSEEHTSELQSPM